MLIFVLILIVYSPLDIDPSDLRRQNILLHQQLTQLLRQQQESNSSDLLSQITTLKDSLSTEREGRSRFFEEYENRFEEYKSKMKEYEDKFLIQQQLQQQQLQLSSKANSNNSNNSNSNTNNINDEKSKKLEQEVVAMRAEIAKLKLQPSSPPSPVTPPANNNAESITAIFLKEERAAKDKLAVQYKRIEEELKREKSTKGQTEEQLNVLAIDLQRAKEDVERKNHTIKELEGVIKLLGQTTKENRNNSSSNSNNELKQLKKVII